jgi:ribonuclease P protein component
MANFSFPKAERICNMRDIEKLFSQEAQYEKSGLLALRYLLRDKREGESAIRVLIVVPKKKVRKASNRNRLKRQLREIYRLNPLPRNKVRVPPNKTLLLAVIYSGGEKALYQALEKSFIGALRSIEEKQNR